LLKSCAKIDQSVGVLKGTILLLLYRFLFGLMNLTGSLEELFLLLFFGATLLIQLGYYLLTYLQLARYKLKPHPVSYPPVSVVICARNEADNLAAFLPLVLQQEYPVYEVIVVNDCSRDDSDKVLESLMQQHSHLRVTTIKEVENHEHGKKFALTMGIKAAKYDTLLMTDADCFPTSNDWLTHFANGYGEGKEIVLGYGKYAKQGGILNTFIRFDAFFIAVQYLSMALKGNAYMGVGRNLSYSKKLFFGTKGFASHMHIQSGDDDLFINEVATPTNVSVVVDQGAFTVSVPKKTWKSWFLQKKRHHSTATCYKSSHKSALVIYPLSWYIFYAVVITGLIIKIQVLILISGLFLRTFLQIAILHATARKLGETDLGWKAPFIELIQRLIVNPLYFVSTFFVRTRRWT